MQVYVNAFEVQGDGAEGAVLRAIHGWLSQQIDVEFSVSDLKTPNTWQGSRNGKSAWLKTFVCVEDETQSYAWRLKHGDDSVPGRQWTVEIGLGCDPGKIRFSCSVQTDEQSTQVTEQVTPSRPRLIGYLLSNVESEPNAEVDPVTPGRSVKRLGESEDDYRAFLTEVQNPKRDFPFVIVSPDREGRYLIRRDHLQSQLFGLAQVVEVVDGFDSYEMESVLGRHWSAWDGAVNVIRIPHPSGKVIGNPILSEQIRDQGDTQTERIAHILGRVTHNTNIPRLRMQISPDGVLHRANRIRFEQRLARLREEAGGENTEQVDQLLNDLIEFDEQQRELLDDNEQLESSLRQANEEKQALDYEIRRLKYLARHSPWKANDESKQEDSDVVAPSHLALSLIASDSEPSPAEALELIESGYPDKVVILPSARESAEEAFEFQQGRRLFDMLRRLVTEYRDKIRESGDSEARSVFTPNEYAARESETVMNSPKHIAYREFHYNGAKIQMLRHLRIGVADDERKAIRVHFEWDSEGEKIVIGHCGRHLPIPNR